MRPSLLPDALAAQMIATYQRLSGGRLLLDVVVGSHEDVADRIAEHHELGIGLRAAPERRHAASPVA